MAPCRTPRSRRRRADVLRLTWRNLLARKVRLLMSTLAIVLGIGFLAGVLTFSTRPRRHLRQHRRAAPPPTPWCGPRARFFRGQRGVGTTKRSPRPVVDKLAALPEVAAADGSVDGFGCLPARQGRQARRRHRARPRWRSTTYAASTSPATRSCILESGELARQARRDHPRHLVGRARRLRGRRRGHPDLLPTGSMPPTYVRRSSAPPTSTAAARPAPPSSLLDTSEAQDLFLDGEDAFTSVDPHGRRRGLPEGAAPTPPDGPAPTASPP